jgi:hypothetical protein
VNTRNTDTYGGPLPEMNENRCLQTFEYQSFRWIQTSEYQSLSINYGTPVIEHQSMNTRTAVRSGPYDQPGPLTAVS